MDLQHPKALTTGTWLVLMLAVGAIIPVTSPSGWTVLAILTLIPPAVVWHFWHAPAESLSESIRKVLR